MSRISSRHDAAAVRSARRWDKHGESDKMLGARSKAHGTHIRKCDRVLGARIEDPIEELGHLLAYGLDDVHFLVHRTRQRIRFALKVVQIIALGHFRCVQRIKLCFLGFDARSALTDAQMYVGLTAAECVLRAFELAVPAYFLLKCLVLRLLLTLQVAVIALTLIQDILWVALRSNVSGTCITHG